MVVHPERERVRPEPQGMRGGFSASERDDVGRVGFAPWFRHGRTRSFELRGRRGIHPSAPGTLVCFAALHVGAPFGYLDWLGLFVLAVVGDMIGGLTLVTLFRLLQVPDERRENDPDVRR